MTTKMTRSLLPLTPLGLLLFVGLCLPNCEAGHSGTLGDPEPQGPTDPWLRECHDSNECPEHASCIRPCELCGSRCRVACTSFADCKAVGAGFCTLYEIDGVQSGYCSDKPFEFQSSPHGEGAVDGGSCALQEMDDTCACPMDFCNVETCDQCCFVEVELGVYEDGRCEPAPPYVESDTTSGAGGTGAGGTGGAGAAGGAAGAAGSD